GGGGVGRRRALGPRRRRRGRCAVARRDRGLAPPSASLPRRGLGPVFGGSSRRRPILLRLCRLLTLALPLAPAAPTRLQLRLRQVVRERPGNVLGRPELLARSIEQLIRARRVPLSRSEQRCTDGDRLVERRV